MFPKSPATTCCQARPAYARKPWQWTGRWSTISWSARPPQVLPSTCGTPIAGCHIMLGDRALIADRAESTFHLRADPGARSITNPPVGLSRRWSYLDAVANAGPPPENALLRIR